MKRFNLLPWREERRRQRKREFHRLLALAALLGLSIVLAVSAMNAGRLSLQHDRNQLLAQENAALDLRLAEIRGLSEEIDALNARRMAVERLQQIRTAPVHLFDELVRRVPTGIALNSLKQGERVLLSGHAQSNARVSELLHALAGEPRWLGRAELVEIKAASQGQGRDARRVVEFTVALGGAAIAAGPP